MARFRQWETLVAPYVTGHSVPALEDAARNAAIDFMQRTRIDTRVRGNLFYDPDEPDMGMPLASNETTPYQAINVWTTHGWVNPRTRREIDERYPDGFVGVTVTDPRDVWGWISLRPGLVRLIPSLSIETTLRMEIAYQPKRTAAVIDDYLFDLYGEQIAWGCIARMLMHRDVPYSNPGMAPAFDARFEQAISRLMNRAGAGHNKPRLQSGGDALS